MFENLKNEVNNIYWLYSTVIYSHVISSIGASFCIVHCLKYAGSVGLIRQGGIMAVMVGSRKFEGRLWRRDKAHLLAERL
jgi:hypothetical protein